jgi:DNA invertase Pin-like site-specific DNA recombinase
MRYIIYTRKSSESEDRQVMSLDAQEQEMKRMAERQGLEVIIILRESMSAKAPGRPVFMEMMALLSAGKADGILCWKLDRLARNPVDGGTISWLLQQSQIKSIRTPDREYLPKDNVLLMSVEFGMSNQYVRDLSENVKRGNREKLRRGGWPNHAPYGYINDKTSKSIVVNPSEAPWVIRMFQLYSSGKSYRDISNILYQAGLRTKSGRKVFKSIIQRIVTKPFYYGMMHRNGILYPGKHEPIISKHLFDQAHEVVRLGSRPRRQKLLFPLRGPLRCKSCNCMLTASLKKGFRYYYCTNGKGVCEQGSSYMREEYIQERLATEFESLYFDEKLVDMMYHAAKERGGINISSEQNQIENIHRELQLISEREVRLTEAMASGRLKMTLYDIQMTKVDNDRTEG